MHGWTSLTVVALNNIQIGNGETCRPGSHVFLESVRNLACHLFSIIWQCLTNRSKILNTWACVVEDNLNHVGIKLNQFFGEFAKEVTKIFCSVSDWNSLIQILRLQIWKIISQKMHFYAVCISLNLERKSKNNMLSIVMSWIKKERFFWWVCNKRQIIKQ